MKSCLCLILFLHTILLASQAQDIPLFSQKLTNSFIYNPALAGTMGAVTLAHRTAFSKVEGSGTLNYLSVDIPVVDKNFGVGLNVFNEGINFMNNTFISAAFAYHINLGSGQLISMGLAGEYNILRPDYDKVVGDASDELLRLLDNGNYDKPDFSAGLNYQHPFFKIGIGINRLATAFGSENKKNILSQYFTGQISGQLPVRQGKDLFEPTFTYRKYSRASRIFDMGAYYTYASVLMLGASVRMGSSNDFSTVQNDGIDIINITVGLKVMEKLLLGYSRDITTRSAGQLGVGNEITLRFDFLEADFTSVSGSRRPAQYPGKYKIHKRGNPRKYKRKQY